MKKILFCGAIVFLALAVPAFAERADERAGIEETIKAYEDIVVEAETLAAKPLINSADFSAIDEKAKAAEPMISAIQNEQEWLIQDAKVMAELRARLNKAIATITQNLYKF